MVIIKMYGVDKIEISIISLNNSIDLEINLNSNIVISKNKIYNINNEKIKDLFNIILLWKSKENYNNIIDNEEILIKIISNNNEETIYYNGVYPDNYDEFREWISDYYD